MHRPVLDLTGADYTVQYRAGFDLSVAMEFIPERGEPDIDLSDLVLTTELRVQDGDGYLAPVTSSLDATHMFFSIPAVETALMSGAYQLDIITDVVGGGQRTPQFTVTLNAVTT